MENLTDKDLDFAVRNLDNRLVDKAIDELCSNNSKIDLLQGITPLMKLWNNYRKIKDKPSK